MLWIKIKPVNRWLLWELKYRNLPWSLWSLNRYMQYSWTLVIGYLAFVLIWNLLPLGLLLIFQSFANSYFELFFFELPTCVPFWTDFCLLLFTNTPFILNSTHLLELNIKNCSVRLSLLICTVANITLSWPLLSHMIN